MKIFRMAIVAMALLSFSGLALSQGGLGKKERGNSSGGSSSGGSQNERSRPPAKEDPPRRESPPVRDSPPPSQRERPPVRESAPPPTQRERPPVRESTPPPTQRERPPIRENNPPPTERERPPIRETVPPPSQRERPPIRENIPPDPGQGSLGKGRGNGNSGGSSGGNQGRNDPPARNSGGNDRNSGGNDRNSGDQNRPPLGRIDNPQRGGNDRIGGGNSEINGVRREGQGALGRSRPGDKPYGTNNNQRGQSRDRSPINIGKAPTSVLGGTLEHQVRREDRTREIHNRGYRVGYWGYSNGWNDDLFCFRNYVFDPYSNYRCVASPWYYYPHLPGYLNYSCVRVIQINFGPFHWVDYRWTRPYGYNGGYGYNDYSNRYSELDYAVDDIERAFERNDERALGRVMPRRGDVNIWADGRYQYTITADAYYDLMEDNVFSTQTKQYEIISVRTSRGSAEVQARHTYLDPWDRRVTVYHWYRLERERDGYVVRDFGTSDGRW